MVHASSDNCSWQSFLPEMRKRCISLRGQSGFDHYRASAGAAESLPGLRGATTEPKEFVHLEQSHAEGRHLVAGVNISADSDVLSEEAECAVLFRRHRKQVKQFS